MTTTSFLPEDYLDQKAERRTNLISLTLFGIVMVSVFAAFLVTNRQWSQVKAARVSINSQYEDAATQIERLTALEQQKDQMLNKARLAAALVERVPRSILLAEMVRRMPPRMSLLSFELTSTKVRVAKAPAKPSGRRAPVRAPTKEQAAAAAKKKEEEENKVEVPAYTVSVRVVGMAATDLEVSGYIAELSAYPLLLSKSIVMEYSEERKDGRQFAIKADLDPKRDVRDVVSTTPKPAEAGPAAPGAADRVSAQPRRQEGG